MPPKSQAKPRPNNQYQHYIPRFILRKFLETQGPPKTAKQRSKDNWKAKKKGIETELINVYDLSAKTLQSLSISKSFGEINLYTDLANAVNFQHVEEKLSRLENEASQAVAAIHAATSRGSFTLTRHELGVLRKFVFIMHFRKPTIQAAYFGENREKSLEDWIRRYMQTHNIKTREDMWLHGLAYILDTPHPKIVAKGEEILAQYGEARIMQMMATRVDPNLESWFAVDYQSLANSHFLGVWEAAPGCEFILGNNCFGLWEGLFNGLPGIHRIFIISPRLVLILRHILLREEVKGVIPTFNHSALINIETPSPTTTYHGSFDIGSPQAMMKYRVTAAAQKDTFTYKITKLTGAQTREVNEVILLNVPRDGALVFLSKEHALKAVRYHISSPDPVVQLEQPNEKFRPLLHSLENDLYPRGKTAVIECDADFRLRVAIEVIRHRLDRFLTEWDAAYWSYQAMTADPNQSHPLVLDMRIRLTQAKTLFGVAPGGTSRRNPSARLSDHLNEEDSNCVLGRMSTMLLMLMNYQRTRARTEAAFVRESVIVGLIEWMVKEKPDRIEQLIGSDTYRRLTRGPK
ncbi:hypothetical protein D9756_003522 [Leucocoprinus leucothites]|uniref:DUF4238 domain-containing protein n=1 Tax=Leucocoprinus leucothites TaxID=201217 RepID=A0A8H5LIY3_9AGAR|nr:hypothetical protein D9756_003522 [Leucoagaricus leucothites]